MPRAGCLKQSANKNALMPRAVSLGLLLIVVSVGLLSALPDSPEAFERPQLQDRAAGNGRPSPDSASTRSSPSLRTSRTESRSCDRLVQRIHQRLLLMEAVAQWKWNQSQPIEDTVRENALLDQLEAKARLHDLSPPFVRAFFTAQISEAKRVQQTFFDRWTREGQETFPEVPDLATQQRPAIDAATNDLFLALVVQQLSIPSEPEAARLQQAIEQIPEKGPAGRAAVRRALAALWPDSERSRP